MTIMAEFLLPLLLSVIAGHGPGVNPILSSKEGRIRTRIDPNANIAYYLGLRAPPKR